MSFVLTSKDLMAGKTGTWDKNGLLSQPIQMIKKADKDEQWQKENMDWWEHLGVMQLREKYKRVLKNYNLAEGVIDKSDYIPDTSANEYGEMISILTKENESPYEIRFYALVPNIIQVLLGEFSKRNNKILIKAVDEYAINEMLDKKKEMITDYLIQKVQQSVALSLSQQGVDLNSDQGQQKMQSIMSLPQIQEFFQKTYRSIAEEWATHELNEAEERFRLYELEIQGFKDKLISNEEFWHVRLVEGDYEVELWNPINTFYHKSPDVAYVSECNYVGRIHLLTVADVIDRFGYKMTEDQIKSLQKLGSLRNGVNKIMPQDSMPTDFYNTTKKPSEQIQSIHWSQAVATQNILENKNKPFFEWLREDNAPYTGDFLVVTEVYWRSQKRVGQLKQIDEHGVVFEDLVSEDFKITVKPEYDTTINKKETKDNLIFGQHIDWTWINEIWQGTKVGLSMLNSWAGMSDSFEPIYLDVRPLPFQFKADNSLYGAKLPVEGFLGYNRNVKKLSLVGKMKPFQIGFNMTNNQIFDMLVDEVWNVLMFDQNMIPRNSLDGSWGKYNFSKAFQVMKNFGILPIDSSITNTDTPINFGQTSVVNLEKTNQLKTRIELSEYFKNECYAAVGVSPQRLGEVTPSESATGAQYAVNNSYSQTEMLFVEHSNYLMPRVKEMILNAAQYINANKDVIRKTYINRDEENIFFEIEGTRILLSDLRIYCSAKPDQKAIIDQLKQLAINNNTSGATIFDLAKIIQSSSVSEVLETLKKSVQTAQEQEQQKMAAEQQNLEKQIQAQSDSQAAQRDFEATQSDLQRANERYIAEIRALGFAKDTDINQNDIPDALEVDKFNAEQGNTRDEMILKNQKLTSDNLNKVRDTQLKERELELKRQQLAETVRLKEEQLKLDKQNQKNDLAVAKANARNKNKK